MVFLSRGGLLGESGKIIEKIGILRKKTGCDAVIGIEYLEIL